MTQSTYTIAHIKVGAKKYWEEVGGFVSGDKKELILENIKDKIAFLKELNTAFQSKLYIPWKVDEEYFNDIFKQNPSHPLSELANRLGATIYGGFEDEKDFHLMLPTCEGYASGSVITITMMENSRDWLLGYSNEDCHFTIMWQNSDSHHLSAKSLKEYLEMDKAKKEQQPENYEKQKFIQVKGNIFQEYARTGIIENDLYEQFFK